MIPPGLRRSLEASGLSKNIRTAWSKDVFQHSMRKRTIACKARKMSQRAGKCMVYTGPAADRILVKEQA